MIWLVKLCCGKITEKQHFLEGLLVKQQKKRSETVEI